MFKRISNIAIACIALCVTSFDTRSEVFTLDVDADGKTDALTDGLIVIRYLFGFSGESLTASAVAFDANRASAEEIEVYLGQNEDLLDVDGDGSVDALSDGLLIIRDLFGFSGVALTNGAVTGGAARDTSSAVIDYIKSIKDSDNDGYVDSTDLFPLDAAEWLDADGDGIGNNSDTDDDGDGVLDAADAFPLDATETIDTDIDGIGNNSDTDDDGDGVLDAADAFPLDATETIDTDIDGIGNNSDTDDDGDGVLDAADAFPLDATETIDTDIDGIGNNSDTDDDGDGVLDAADAFPLDATETIDTDIDGIGNNSDTDDDGDGVLDAADAFPLDATETIDTDIDGIGNNSDTDDDGDGVLDAADAFPLDATETIDTDIDGIGNNSDTDDDGDGVLDAADAFPLDATETIDTDIDGIGNNSDTDDDGDGVLDAADAFPLDATETIDTDIDGIGNNSDTDDDGDGVLDAADAFPLDAAFSDYVSYNAADIDGDGIINRYDADDDGDGLLDKLDADAADASNQTQKAVLPWINQFKFEGEGRPDNPILNVVIAKYSSTECSAISINPYNAQGQPIGRFFSATTGTPVDSLVATDVVKNYRGNTGCDGISKINDLDFIALQISSDNMEDDGTSLDQIVGVYLNFGSQCIEVVSFGQDIRPANSGCDEARYFDLPGSLELTEDYAWSRSGSGMVPEDFTAWYKDTRARTASSGWVKFANNYQILEWSPVTGLPEPDVTELGVLDLPKPRNSVMKAYMDIGWLDPARNSDSLKIYQVSEVKDEYIEDDGVSTYGFISDKIRPDFIEWRKFSLEKLIETIGSPRSENYFHHFGYPSDVLNEIAFRRGRLDAKFDANADCTAPGPDYFAAGSGAGYVGSDHSSWLNDQLTVVILDEEGSCTKAPMRPKRNDDTGFQPVSPDNPAEDKDYLGEGSTYDLLTTSIFGRARDKASNHHEWFHTWEQLHLPGFYPMGPFRYGHDRADWESNPIFHGFSIPLELYIREYVIDDRNFDGNEKLWSLQAHDRPMWDFKPSGGWNFLERARSGDQGVETMWANYLLKHYGFEKMYSEFYRRAATAGEFRVALHQTYGRTFDQTLQDAEAWLDPLYEIDDLAAAHKEYRLLFDTAEEFKANLNQSFSVSFLQARNDSTPNSRYQTLYTFVGSGAPEDIGTTWVPVQFATDKLTLTEAVELTVTASESGQLQINGHDAYFYSNDSSVFHAGGLAASDDWSAFTRRGERTSDLWFPVFIYDHDEDGLPDDYDPDYQAIYFTEDGRYKLDVWPDDPEFTGPGQQFEAALFDTDGVDQ